MSTMQGQRVLILGLGVSGLAMARWCSRKGAQVTVVDTRQSPPQREALLRDCPQARLLCAALNPSQFDLSPIQAVYCSPGIAPAQLAPILEAAKARGIYVGGELDLFALALSTLAQTQGYAPYVLAITGTNGKTTVTSLTGRILQRAGKRVAVAGNIGPSLLDTLHAAQVQAQLPEIWVLELSSFQLHTLRAPWNPHAATVLNLTQDHLDWHGSMDDYGRAKARIFGSGTLRVLPRDDQALLTGLQHWTGVVGAARGRKAPAPIPQCSFGLGAPSQPGDFGIASVQGLDWLVRALPDDDTRGQRELVPALHVQQLMPLEALRIRGRHNALNAQAALALASSTGAPLGPMLSALRDYRGEPHRVESVATIDDVEYFDDSKGTNVGATVAALRGLGAERPLVVILGGEGKGQDFAPLAPAVAAHARAVLLIGRDAALIARSLDACPVPMLTAGDLPEAVRQAHAQARKGDAVLLSPACASFDMFDDYAHRARVFVQAVQALASERGQPLPEVA